MSSKKITPWWVWALYGIVICFGIAVLILFFYFIIWIWEKAGWFIFLLPIIILIFLVFKNWIKENWKQAVVWTVIIIGVTLIIIFKPWHWFKDSTPSPDLIVVPKGLALNLIVKPNGTAFTVSSTNWKYFYHDPKMPGYEYEPVDSIGTIYLVSWEFNDTVYRKTNGIGKQYSQVIPGWYKIAADRSLQMKLKHY